MRKTTLSVLLASAVALAPITGHAKTHAHPKATAKKSVSAPKKHAVKHAPKQKKASVKVAH